MRTPSAPLVPSARVASRPAGTSLAAASAALAAWSLLPRQSHRGSPSSRRHRRGARSSVSAGPSSLGAVTRRPALGAHTRAPYCAEGSEPPPPRALPQSTENPRERPLQLEKVVGTRKTGMCVRARAGACGPGAGPRGGWGGRRLTTSAGSRQPLGGSGGSRGWEGMPAPSANRMAKRLERREAWSPRRCLKLGGKAGKWGVVV